MNQTECLYMFIDTHTHSAVLARFICESENFFTHNYSNVISNQRSSGNSAEKNLKFITNLLKYYSKEVPSQYRFFLFHINLTVIG